MSPKRKAVFLDRDGVLNKLVARDGGFYSPQTFEQFELFPWTNDSLQRLAGHGFILVVVTNQPDVTRGKMTLQALELMHETIRRDTPIDAILTCIHDQSDSCECRKPKPGLFLHAAESLNLDLQRSWTIGDREVDLRAGRAAGTRFVHVSSEHEKFLVDSSIRSVNSLMEATDLIIENTYLS